MRIAMLVAGSTAALIWCLTASAQQSGNMLTGADASANRIINETDIALSAQSTTRLVPQDSRAALMDPIPDPATLRRIWLIAPEDKTLQSTISGWCVVAGWQLLWDLPVDYPIEILASISGTFEEAIETIASTMEKADVPIKAIFFKGNKVLRIVAKGSE